jgi:hypothetical protein
MCQHQTHRWPQEQIEPSSARLFRRLQKHTQLFLPRNTLWCRKQIAKELRRLRRRIGLWLLSQSLHYRNMPLH